MKKIVRLLIFLILSSPAISAQKVYFIYLQTDSHQPFYARMGEKVYHSTTAGYLILSSLRDSIYSLTIGVQGSQSTDQLYSITVNKKDQGFLVKNFGEKGWGLFNLSSMAVIMPSVSTVTTKPVQVVKTEKREDNAFTNLLAKAADDSTIKERPVIEKPVEKQPDAAVLTTEKKEEPKNDTKEVVPPKQEEKKEIVPVEKKEELKIDTASNKTKPQEPKNAAVINADSILAEKNKETELKNKETELVKQEALRKQDSIDKTRVEAITNVEYKRSVVKLRSESSTTAGIGLVFIDMLNDDLTDTIRILIPAEITKTIPAESTQAEKKFLDIPPVDSVQKETKKTVIKSDNCKVKATEDDFFKLRKKMVSARNDDGMIAEAKKIFKTKCFSTVQVKNLSTLFLTDEFKYKFFDAAYRYISDLENFTTLQSELKDEYFINRFKAMVQQ